MLRTFVRSSYLLALACWVGAAVFYSLFVLRTLFTSLAPGRAGEIAALLFPGYYAFGFACAVVLALACGYLAYTGGRAWRFAAAAALVMVVCQAVGTGVVHPKMKSLRGVEAGRAEFDRLHRLSVRLNGVILVTGVGLLLVSARLLEER